jgi:predicted outer membrane protein
MPFHNSRLIASACFAGLLAMPGIALAQSQDTQSEEPQVQEQTSPPEVQQDQTDQQTETDTGKQATDAAPTDEELESFATATISIVRIQQAAQKQMQQAVEEAGLTIEDYNRIAQAAKSDPDIDQMLQQLIQDRLGG